MHLQPGEGAAHGCQHHSGQGKHDPPLAPWRTPCRPCRSRRRRGFTKRAKGGGHGCRHRACVATTGSMTSGESGSSRRRRPRTAGWMSKERVFGNCIPGGIRRGRGKACFMGGRDTPLDGHSRCLGKGRTRWGKLFHAGAAGTMRAGHQSPRLLGQREEGAGACRTTQADNSGNHGAVNVTDRRRGWQSPLLEQT